MDYESQNLLCNVVLLDVWLHDEHRRAKLQFTKYSEVKSSERRRTQSNLAGLKRISKKTIFVALDCGLPVWPHNESWTNVCLQAIECSCLRKPTWPISPKVRTCDGKNALGGYAWEWGVAGVVVEGW